MEIIQTLLKKIIEHRYMEFPSIPVIKKSTYTLNIVWFMRCIKYEHVNVGIFYKAEEVDDSTEVWHVILRSFADYFQSDLDKFFKIFVTCADALLTWESS